MKWIIKAFAQKFMGILPCSHRLNFYAQRYLTVGKELPNNFLSDRLLVAKRHLLTVAEYSTLPKEKIRLMEIGTGWYPIVPIVFFLNGFNDILTVDVRKLYTKESLNQSLSQCIMLCETGIMKNFFPEYLEERIDQLKLALKEKKCSTKLERMNIRFQKLDLTKNLSFSPGRDAVISNNTLQFIPMNKLDRFFTQLREIRSKKTIYSLEIDLTDEFSHFDASLSKFNFLRFSSWQWRLITCRLNATNRVRFITYQEQYRKNFSIRKEEIIRAEGSDFGNIEIHRDFKQHNHSDIYIKQGYVVLS